MGVDRDGRHDRQSRGTWHFLRTAGSLVTVAHSVQCHSGTQGLDGSLQPAAGALGTLAPEDLDLRVSFRLSGPPAWQV